MVGYFSTPALGDVDGDLDVVSGESAGGFRTYLLPEPAHGTLLAAGVALLGLLRRARGQCAPAPGRSATTNERERAADA